MKQQGFTLIELMIIICIICILAAIALPIFKDKSLNVKQVMPKQNIISEQVEVKSL